MYGDKKAQRISGNTILTMPADERQEALDELESWLDAAKRLYNNTNLISSANAEEGGNGSNQKEDRLEPSEYRGKKGSYWDVYSHRPEVLAEIWRYIKANGGDPFKMYQVPYQQMPRSAFENISDETKKGHLIYGIDGIWNKRRTLRDPQPDMVGWRVCADGNGKHYKGANMEECMRIVSEENRKREPVDKTTLMDKVSGSAKSATFSNSAKEK